MHLLQLPNGDIETLLLGMSSRTIGVEKSVLNSSLYVYIWEFLLGNGSVGYASTDDVGI